LNLLGAALTGAKMNFSLRKPIQFYKLIWPSSRLYSINTQQEKIACLPFGKVGDFLLEDAMKILHDADIDITDYQICMVFSLSKHTVVINDFEESGQ